LAEEKGKIQADIIAKEVVMNAARDAHLGNNLDDHSNAHPQNQHLELHQHTHHYSPGYNPNPPQPQKLEEKQEVVVDEAREKIKSEFVKKLGSIPARHCPRDEQVNKLCEAFERQRLKRQNQVKVISGIRGVGKSHLALCYAHAYAHEKKDCYIIWIDASREKFLNGLVRERISDELFQEKISNELLKIGEILGVPDIKTMDIKERQEAIKRELTDKSWLIILDGVENKDELSIENLFPPRSLSLIQELLITTSRSTDDWGDPSPMHVPVFTLEEARNYIYFSVHAAQGDSEEFEKLVRKLGFLPLALQALTDYMERQMIIFSESGDAYKEQGITLLPTVFERCKSSIMQLENSHLEKNRRAAEIIKFCAYLDSEKIKPDLLKTLLGVEGAYTHHIHVYIAAGCSSGLLSKKKGDGSISMNCIIQAAIRHYELENEKNKIDVLRQRLIPIIEILLERSGQNKSYYKAHLETVKKYLEPFKRSEETQGLPALASEYFKRILCCLNPEYAQLEVEHIKALGKIQQLEDEKTGPLQDGKFEERIVEIAQEDDSRVRESVGGPSRFFQPPKPEPEKSTPKLTLERVMFIAIAILGWGAAAFFYWRSNRTQPETPIVTPASDPVSSRPNQ
jgi:hypothetical protein